MAAVPTQHLKHIVAFAWFALALLLLVPTQPLAQEAKPLRGVALVIGQSAYQHLQPLANAGNDAKAIDRLLSDLGFEVDSVLDGDRARLDKGLRRFVEDAADADVALLYYSGHGIEAGGENFLVPLDADLSSLDDAANRLVPLSQLLSQLRAASPVSIVLMDACRTSPFPPGASVATAGGPAPIAPAGLAAAKGATPLAASPEGPDSLGTVLGFAAEPGRVALDGEPGGNSPYAAALLKHLSAGGFAFGDVMTMVTEEVYLNTRSQQLPWTNASLRRLLYFGAPAEQADPDEQSIRGARRKLLLTISTVPAQTRGLVEQVARSNGVPLDALYGMLSVLEVDTSGGARNLESQLLAGAGRLRAILAERDLQKRQDPELIRLSGLADRAELEGAIALALDFRARASDRAKIIGVAIDEAEADVKARRLELAETYESHAKTALLNYDFRTAADRYHDAFVQAERWDPDNAFLFKIFQADALTDLGKFRGDNQALAEAVGVYEEAKLLPAVNAYGGPASVVINQGIAMITLAEQEYDTRWVEAAIQAYQQALKTFSRKRKPQLWAIVMLNLGNAYDLMGERGGGRPYVKKGLDAFRQAAKIYDRNDDPDGWAGLQNNIGNSLVALSDSTRGDKELADAVEAYGKALQVWTRERDPVNWSMAQSNLGAALRQLGERRNDRGTIEQAIVALNAALEIRSRETLPMDWAGTQNNLGGAFQALGVREVDGSANFRKALEAYESAASEITRERNAVSWANIVHNIARTWKMIGEHEDGTASLEKALQSIELAVGAKSRENSPVAWARSVSVRGEILSLLGSRTDNRQQLQQAKQDYLTARDVFRAEKFTTNFEKSYAASLEAIDKELTRLK